MESLERITVNENQNNLPKIEQKTEAENKPYSKLRRIGIYAMLGTATVVAAVSNSGCATNGNYYHQPSNYAIEGAAIGAGTGAIIGNQSGRTGRGALIGGIGGAFVGSMVGR